MEENRTLRHVRSGSFADRVSFFIATGFYSGYLPVAPGSWGSLFALLVFWLVPDFRGPVFLGATLLLCGAGVPASTVVAARKGKDPSIVTVDEWAGMWIVLFLISDLRVLWHGIAFCLFRLMDIVKPPPAFQIQSLPGGWGIMADDIIAALYTVFFIRLAYALI